MNAGDLVTRLEADVGGWSAGMERAASDTQQVTYVIHEQRESWSSLAAAALPAIAQVTTAVAGLAGTLATIHHQRTLIASVTGPLAAVGTTALRFIGPVARVVGMLVPQWKLVTTAVAATALAYNVATSETVQDFGRQVSGSEKVTAAVGRLKEAFGNLGSVVSSPLEAGENAFNRFVDAINPLPALVDKTATKVAEFTDTATKGVQDLSSWWQKWLDIAAAAPVIFQEGADADRAQEIFDEAAAIRERAAEQDAALKKLGDVKAAYEALRNTQDAAAHSAMVWGELQEIRNARTIKDLDRIEQAQRKVVIDNIQNGMDADAVNPLFGPIFDAIAQQRRGIEQGLIKPEGQGSAEAYLKSIQAENEKLQGNEGSVLDQFKAKGADPAVLAAIQRELELRQNLNAEKEHQKALDQEAADAERRQEQLRKSAASQIGSLRDQLDLMTGAATKGEIAMRKALEQGHTVAEATQLREMTDEIDRIEQENRKREKVASEKRLKETSGFGALSKGSSEAFTAIFKAGRTSNEERAAKAAEKTAAGMDKLNSSIETLIDATENIGLVGMEIDLT